MITVSNLTKKYGDFLAVDDLSFTIEDGHIYGFLGPNGAGKSTTLNIMTGTLAATDGRVTVDGLDIFEDAKEAKKKIGYLPEIPPLYVDQTPREYLTFVAQAKGVKKNAVEEEVEKAAKEAHIEEVLDKLIKYLSKGYRQRVGIAQALLGNPQVIILDEPTVGLDPGQIIEIRDLIHELGKNHTVILSSHILTEVQAICEKVLIIYKGKLVAFDTPDRLQEKFMDDITIELQIEGGENEIMNCLKEVSDIEAAVKKTEEECAFLTVHVVPSDGVPADDAIRQVSRDLFHAFAKADLPILQMKTNKASLEDIFLELTGAEENAADEAAEENNAADEMNTADAAQDEPADEPMTDETETTENEGEEEQA